MDHPHQQAHEHNKHEGHSVGMFRDTFWFSLALTVPVMLYSEMIQHWLGIKPPAFAGSEYLPALLSSVLFAYGGTVFLKSAWKELKAGLPGMMTLISVAILAAYLYSMATLFVGGEDFFWELASLITIMLLGHWLEMRSIQSASGALETIAKLLPDTAEKLVGGKPVSVRRSELAAGDKVLVRPGTSVPADGVVADGTSSVNEAALTGESKPVIKQAGDEVIAGTLNQDGVLTVTVTKTGEETALAGIMRLIKEAQASKSRAQVLADKAAYLLTLVALAVGAATLAYWSFAESVSFAVERFVAVLIIACPHALGLAVPLVVSISTTLSARNGLLVRKRLALEAARKIDWVLFDKTGTLTKGEHGVTDIWPIAPHTRDGILALVATLEQGSEHIVGKGLVKRAEESGLSLGTVTDFRALPGLGVEGEIDGSPYAAASYRYLEERGLEAPAEIRSLVKKAAQNGKTAVFLLKGTQLIGVFALADIIREESRAAVQTLRTMGTRVAMITGDSEDVAARVADELHLDIHFAEVRPEDKAAKVRELQKDGQRVAMVGDGINDAPALSQADIGIAIGAGTDVAIKSADIILVRDNPMDVVKVIELSKATYRKMVQNLAWATGYNVIAIPLAAGALAAQGILLSPALGAVLMSLSTIIVAVNAQFLRRIHFTS